MAAAGIFWAATERSVGGHYYSFRSDELYSVHHDVMTCGVCGVSAEWVAPGRARPRAALRLVSMLSSILTNAIGGGTKVKVWLALADRGRVAPKVDDSFSYLFAARGRMTSDPEACDLVLYGGRSSTLDATGRQTRGARGGVDRSPNMGGRGFAPTPNPQPPCLGGGLVYR